MLPKATFATARAASGLTQVEAAKLLGISQTSVSHLETDVTKRVKSAYIVMTATQTAALIWQKSGNKQPKKKG